MRKVILLALVAFAAVPAVALADDPPTAADQANAAQACRAQQSQMGAAAFKALYGTNASKSNAFGRCVSAKAKTPTPTPTP